MSSVDLKKVEEIFYNHGMRLISTYTKMKSTVTVRCFCGNSFECIPSDVKRGRKRSCGCLNIDGPEVDFSFMTFGDLFVNGYIEKFRKSGKKEYYWECKCLCGKLLYLSPTRLVKKHAKCKKCSAKRGSSNPNYNGNNRFVERNKLKFIRPQIFKRDNYTCQKCFKTHCVLNAHHLNGWDIFPEQRFDLNNLTTLCKECHDLFHAQFGRGKNTKEQFISFLQGIK